jgi:hypothetical protein
MTKNYLVFAIPAPQIKNIKGIVNGSKVVARYYLKGNILSVVASGLGDISGPFTIDPSVIIANASSFNNVNNEGGVSVDSTNSNIYEGGLTGGSVGTWTDNTGASGFTTARENFASVAYNGNLYVMGGGTQQYTQLISGSSGTWTPPAGTGSYTIEAWGAGGGGGHGGGSHTSGGGAGGGFAAGTYSINSADTYSFAVGAGGAGCSSSASCSSTAGGNSYIYDNTTSSYKLTANGGGGVISGSPTAGGGASGGNIANYSGSAGGGGAAGQSGGHGGGAAAQGGNGSIFGPGLPGSASGATLPYYAGAGGDYTSGVSGIPGNPGLNYGGGGSSSWNGGAFAAGGTGANGYIVITYDAPSYLSDIQYTALSSSGTLSNPGCGSTWCSAGTLPNSRQGLQAVAYNGYLYILGGQTSSINTIGNNCNTGSSAPIDCSDIQYASINSNGKIGSWNYSSSNSFSIGRAYFGATVYNGYLYISGGQTAFSTTNCTIPVTTFSGSTAYACNDIQYTSLKPDGSLTAPNGCTPTGYWCQAAPFTIARQGTQLLSSNGYLYILGGLTGSFVAGSCSNGAVGAYYCNDVQYNSINANGSLGSATWISSSAFTTPRAFFGALVYNGYLYISGGVTPATATNCNTNNADDPEYCSDVQYDNINSNGSIGSTWQNSTNLTSPGRDGNSMVSYNGYQYILGGYSPANSGGCTASSYYCNDVQVAPIATAGALGSSAITTNSLPIGTRQATTIAYNGYVYVMGGFTTVATTDVVYSQISSNGIFSAPLCTGGSLGGGGNVWCTASSSTGALPTATAQSASVVYNGYVYEVGGFTSAATASVYYTKLSSTNGSLGAPSGCTPVSSTTWCAASSLPIATYSATAAIYNGYIYEIGGTTSSNTASVEYSKISNTGALNPPLCTGGSLGGGGNVWCTASSSTGALPTATAQSASVIYNGYVYEVGGFTSAATASVYYTKLSSTNGSLGAPSGCTPVSSTTWCAASSLPAASYGNIAVIWNNTIYSVGSYSSYTVYYAPLNTNGSISSGWASGSLNSSAYPPYQATAIVYSGSLYTFGGNLFGFSSNSVSKTVLNNGGPGGVASFSSPSITLPNLTWNATSVVNNGYIYVVGGSTGSATASVEYSIVSSNGSLSPPACSGGVFGGGGNVWCTATGSLPNPTSNASSVVYNGYVYEIGGTISGSSSANVVYTALLANGSLSAPTCAGTLGGGGNVWCTATGSLPNPASNASSVVYNGYVYEIGGTISGSSSANVVYALISTNGSLTAPTCTGGSTSGVWCTATGSLPNPTSNASSVEYNGYIYEIGGYTGSVVSSSVYYSQIGTNGSIGTWNSATDLPFATENSSAIGYDGYLYEVGGYDGTSATKSIYYAAISNNGFIGDWNISNSLPSVTEFATTVVYNGSVYEIGGYSGASGYNAVSYGGLQSIPRIGKFSKLINIGTSSRPSAFILYGNIVNGVNNSSYALSSQSITPGDGQGGASFSYSMADASCPTLDSPTNLIIGSGITFKSVYRPPAIGDGCAGISQYVWLKVILDDSQSASFPDSSSYRSNISGIYYYWHPAPVNRLRGGKTFSNNLIQSLDTSP